MATHCEIIYTRVPVGMPDTSCFRLVEAPLPRPVDGQVLARRWLRAWRRHMRSGDDLGKQVVRLAPAGE